MFIRIALLVTQSGPPAATAAARQMRDGFHLAAIQRDGLLGGLKVLPTIIDDAGDPAVALTRLGPLLDAGAIDVVVGPVDPTILRAILPRIGQATLLSPLGAPPDLQDNPALAWPANPPGQPDPNAATNVSAAFQAQWHMPPTPEAEAGYDAAMLLDTALPAAGGLGPALPGALRVTPFVSVRPGGKEGLLF